MNEAQVMIKSFKQETVDEYANMAANCSPQYVAATAKQVAHRKLKKLMRDYNKEFLNKGKRV